MQRRMEAEWYILIYAKESEVINMKKAKRNVAVNGLMMLALFFSTMAVIRIVCAFFINQENLKN